MEHHSVGDKLFLKRFYVKGREIVAHSGGRSRGLTRDGTVGDNSGDVPHRIGDRYVAPCGDQIFDLFSVETFKR